MFRKPKGAITFLASILEIRKVCDFRNYIEWSEALCRRLDVLEWWRSKPSIK